MFIAEKDRKRLLPEIVKLDLVSQGEMEAAVSNYSRVALRVEHVAKVIANLEEEFRRVEEYKWGVKDWHIDLRNYDKNMDHLNKVTVAVNLYANRKADDDGADNITRRIQFPRKYLVSDNWLEEAKATAATKRLWWLERWIDEVPDRVKQNTERLRPLVTRPMMKYRLK